MFGKKSNKKNTIKKKHYGKGLIGWWEKLPRGLRRGILGVALTFVFTVFFCGAAFMWYAFIYLDDEFDLASIDNSLDYTTIIYAKNDAGEMQEVERLHKGTNREWVNLAEIPDDLQWAFIAIEDKRFYTHSGVDLIRTARAILNFAGGSSSFGGSTITQQLIKNITGDDDVKISRKIQEIRRAWYLEKEYKKDQILEAYLNTIYLSQGCNGVQTAAKVYFGKDVGDLTLAECACIAAITKYPTKYDPLQNPEDNKKRQEIILNEMVSMGKATKEEAEAAKAETLKFSTGSENKETGSKQSYFADQVIEDVLDALINEKGYTKSYANSLIFSGGLQIYSTMDIEVQQKLDAAYKETKTFTTYELAGDEKPQSAMVIIDNTDGSVAALAGGRGEKDLDRGLNRATQTYRQPGSCMKPIGTYAPAIEYGIKIGYGPTSPGTLVLDKSVTDTYPKNYNEPRYGTNKLMTVQQAIANSTNTVAYRVNMALGAKKAYNFLSQNLGITTLVPGESNDENNQASSLGGLTKGISVMEITAAYAAFPTGGTYTKPYTFTKVLDSNGKVLLENKIESHSAMSANTAAIMNQMLQYVVTAGTGTPANFGTTAIAGKTGTTNADRDRWFVGYTSYYTAGVWYGYDSPKTIKYGGVNPAVKAWKTVMSKVHSGLPYKELPTASNLISAEYCTESGMAPTEACRAAQTVASARYIGGAQPSQPCTTHVVETPPVTTPETPTTPGVTPNTPDAGTQPPTDQEILPDSPPDSTTTATDPAGATTVTP